jgi:hypothetical protein
MPPRPLALAALALALTASGCGRWAVRPQEKEFLSDRIMQLDYNAAETAADQHVLSNREGSSGANGTGGGGCGCN